MRARTSPAILKRLDACAKVNGERNVYVHRGWGIDSDRAVSTLNGASSRKKDHTLRADPDVPVDPETGDLWRADHARVTNALG
jgi:hypothetical protein